MYGLVGMSREGCMEPHDLYVGWGEGEGGSGRRRQGERERIIQMKST